VLALRRGEVNRADAGQIDAGGKGVNVSRALAANGVATLAVLPLAGPDGELLGSLLTQAGIDFVAVPVGGATRSNVAVVEPDGTLTKINAAGHALTTAEVDALLATATSGADPITWVVGCGSLPPDTRPDFYAVLVERARATGARVAVDTSGPPLAACLAARPDLVKPSLEELAELVGRPLDTIDEVVEAAAELRRDGPHTVVVSLGAHGAVLVDGRSEPLLAVPPPIVPLSNVGAGDALLAGFLAGGDALRGGVAYGSAAASLPGTSMPGPHQIDLDGVRLQPAAGSGSLTQPSRV
jgi:1-phosphofructokinase family hexose kinase